MAAGLELGRYIEAGDLRRAGEWLVKNYAADVVAMCRAMVRERHAAEDLTQDVFSSAFTNLSSFRREASPRTWILAITRNRCIDHLRRLSRDPWGGVAAEEAEPDRYADEAPLPADVVLHRADLEAAMSSLAEAERALVVLRFRHGLDYPELANVFGLREGTVRMRLSRALAKMRGELEAADESVHARAMPMPAPGAAPRPQPAPAAPPARSASSAPPPRAAPPPAQLSSAAPLPRASWWSRLLSWMGVISGQSPAPSSDEQPSAELQARLETMVRRLPSR